MPGLHGRARGNRRTAAGRPPIIAAPGTGRRRPHVPIWDTQARLGILAETPPLPWAFPERGASDCSGAGDDESEG